VRKLLVVLVLASALAACGPKNDASGGKVAVVANFYPIAYAAQRVGGGLVSVRSLTPAGVEPHDLELVSDDVDRILGADIVFYIGSGFQPAVAAAAKRRDHNTVDVSSGLVGRGDASAIAAQEGSSVHSNDRDPHFWLDPTLMIKAVERIRRGLKAVDKAHAATYDANARRYEAQLRELDADFKQQLAHCARTEIVTAHAAFYYLSKRYGLEQFAVTGVSPEAEPDPGRVADLSDRIRRDGVTTVFYEELVPRDFADTLARETGARVDVLSPIEGLTKKEIQAGDSYLTVMRRNLAALVRALDCS
jgi:zinc transport system substrate-binding protein